MGSHFFWWEMRLTVYLRSVLLRRMDNSGIILTAAIFSILANALKVWEFCSSRFVRFFKKNLKNSLQVFTFHASFAPSLQTPRNVPSGVLPYCCG